MMRDELLERIAAVPPGTDFGVQLGTACLDILDLVPWGDGQFVALKSDPNDLLDLLRDRQVPAEERRRIARGCGIVNVKFVNETGTD